MWRIYRNSLVERGGLLPTVNEVDGRRGSEIARMFPERTPWMRVRCLAAKTDVG